MERKVSGKKLSQFDKSTCWYVICNSFYLRIEEILQCMKIFCVKASMVNLNPTFDSKFRRLHYCSDSFLMLSNIVMYINNIAIFWAVVSLWPSHEVTAECRQTTAGLFVYVFASVLTSILSLLCLCCSCCRPRFCCYC